MTEDLLQGKPVNLRGDVHLQVCHQEGDKPALVFLHGGLGNRFNWRYQYEFFAQEGREVLVYDLAGHGDSTPYSRYSLGRHRRDLNRLLSALKIENPILCCHSYGVPLGLEWAQKHAVKGMIFVAGGTHDLDPWWEIPSMKLLKWVGRHLLHLPSLQNVANSLTSNHTSATMERFFAESPTPTDIHAYHALEIFWGYNFFKRYQNKKAFEVPVLVFTGGQDSTFTKEMGDELASHFHHSKHLHFPAAGHVLMVEYEQEFNRAIQKWIQYL
ncbi:MAG: 2-succinyl-6-hydroxy-2,4-cyclohexadiene-1-carboxylate synthase [Chroococcopsis gigantea SAG 12.99]|jgi:pimeloyl-ACP methyl ester carboxylesterase|nr:2-succinyl-6-hydroxy-2,4-cyclohexadiene-1-carboxylate synthase [Chroococcopsis gigantea SAG 12.99]